MMISDKFKVVVDNRFKKIRWIFFSHYWL